MTNGVRNQGELGFIDFKVSKAIAALKHFRRPDEILRDAPRRVASSKVMGRINDLQYTTRIALHDVRHDIFGNIRSKYIQGSSFFFIDLSLNVEQSSKHEFISRFGMHPSLIVLNI